MAIVRTTPKETGNTGSAPPEPADKTKSAVARPPAGPPARRTPVAVSPGGRDRGRSQAIAKPGSGMAFINETMVELRRVVWPTWKEVEAGSIVTVGLLIFFAIYIFGLDFITSKLFIALGLLPKGTS